MKRNILFGVSPIILAWLTLASLTSGEYLYAAICGLTLWIDIERFFNVESRKPLGPLSVGFLLGIAVIDAPMGFAALAVGQTSNAITSFMALVLIAVWIGQSLSLVRDTKCR